MSHATVYELACGDTEVMLRDSLGGEVILVDLEPSDALIIDALRKIATVRSTESLSTDVLSVERWTFTSSGRR